MEETKGEATDPASKEDDFVVEIRLGADHEFVDYIRFDPQDAVNGKPDEVTNSSLEEAAEKEVEQLTFEGLLESWAQSCHGFLDAFPLFSFVTHHLNHRVSGQELIEFLDSESKSKEDTKKPEDDRDYVTYTLGRQHLDFAYRQVLKRKRFESAEEALSRSQLLAVVSEYEAFMADLLRIAIRITPESFISSSQTVNANAIIKGNNLDQIRATIIEDYITDLQRGSHVDVVTTIFKQLNLMPPDDITLREFGEVCLRRNTLTHANGVANKVYRREMRKLGFDEKDIPEEDERLEINDRYMRRSIARMFQMGYFTGHLVWQHLQKHERKKSIDLIINHSHDFIIGKYTKICGRLCKFGLHAKSPAGEIERAYLIVNLALSFLLDDNLSEERRAEGIQNALSKRDWSIVDSRFAMALCCIKEEYEKFGELFDIVKDRDFYVNDFMGLAIFSKARAQPIFKEKMREHYGVEIETYEEDEDESFIRSDRSDVGVDGQ